MKHIRPVEVPACPEWCRGTTIALAHPEFKIDAASGFIEIFDVIGGDGVTPAKMSAALRAIPGSITVRINSPGGNFFDGIAIFNIFAQHPRPVIGEVIGLVGSAASIILMGCNPIRMAQGAQILIHQACGTVYGTSDALEEVAQALREVDGTMAGIYAERSGVARAEVLQMMRDETFIEAAAAVKLGFADEVLTRNAVLTQQVTASRQRLEREYHTAGFSRSQASKMAAAAWTALGRAVVDEPTPEPLTAPKIDLDAIATAIVEGVQAAIPPRPRSR